MSRSSHLTLAATLLAFGGLSACSDATGSSMRPVSLSFSTAPGAAAAVAPSLAVGAGPLVVTKAQLVFSKTELELVGASCANMIENDDDGCAELKMGPMIVDLPLDALPRTALTVTIPAGTYKKFDFRVDAVDGSDSTSRPDAAAFLAAHPEFRGVSVRVEGTYNGQPFVFTTDLDVDLEREFVPPLPVDAGSNNVTVHVDVGTWFVAQDGSTIDPSTANVGGSNKSIVENNIKNSIKAYQDDDRDGRQD